MKKKSLNLSQLKLKKETISNLGDVTGGQLPKSMSQVVNGSFDDCDTWGSRYCAPVWVNACISGGPIANNLDSIKVLEVDTAIFGPAVDNQLIQVVDVAVIEELGTYAY